MRRWTSTLVWTPELEAKAKSMWEKGHSSQDIATALKGFSRSAVMGKIHRSGWVQGERLKKPQDTFRKIRPTRHPAPRPAIKTKAPIVFGDIHAKRPEPRPKPQSNIVSLEARPFRIAKDGCKWPIGEGSQMVFCCNPIERGSYCAGHAEIAYVRKKAA